MTFRCPGCGKTESRSDDRPAWGDPGMVMNIPISPPAEWRAFGFWAQNQETGQVRHLALSCCSLECVKRCAAGEAEPWANAETAALDRWIAAPFVPRRRADDPALLTVDGLRATLASLPGDLPIHDDFGPLRVAAAGAYDGLGQVVVLLTDTPGVWPLGFTPTGPGSK